jgi:hypothetical protein
MADEDTAHEDELEAYLAMPQIPYQTDWDALKWWEKNAIKFPNLSVMARQYLAAPRALRRWSGSSRGSALPLREGN